MTMDELVKTFSHPLRNVSYIQEEKAKVQHFINNFPISFKERIEYNNPTMMDMAIQKARIFYEQDKQRNENVKLCPNKRKYRFVHDKKGGKPDIFNNFGKRHYNSNLNKNNNEAQRTQNYT